MKKETIIWILLKSSTTQHDRMTVTEGHLSLTECVKFIEQKRKEVEKEINKTLIVENFKIIYSPTL